MDQLDLHPESSEYHDKINPDIADNNLVLGLAQALGVPAAMITSKFRELCKQRIRQRHPRWRKSALRQAVLENRFGVPVLVSILPEYRKRLEMVLMLLDVVETMHQDLPPVPVEPEPIQEDDIIADLDEPETVTVGGPVVTVEVTQEVAPNKRGPGRPPGAKNKPKGGNDGQEG